MATALRIVLIIFLPMILVSATIYVPDDHPTIQDAINASVDGDTVIVRPGTYEEIVDFLGKAIHLKSEAGPDTTTIDGKSLGSVVTFKNGEGPGSIIEGFTITNGRGTPNLWGDLVGGNIYCLDSSPVIRNNTITRSDRHVFSGGGIYCEKTSSPLIEGNTITWNRATFGGGITCYKGPTPIIRDNFISSNMGGIYCQESAPIISGNVITDNNGNGIACHYIPSPTIINNIIARNTSGDGGGILCSYSSPEIRSTTITRNSAINQGGGISCWQAYPMIRNSIIWGNSAATGEELYGGTPDVAYCNVRGGYPGLGNIDADPLFTDGFYLAQAPCQPYVSNPCVDAGDPGSAMIDGTTRTDGVQDAGIVDMGFHYPGPVQGNYIYVPGDYPTIQEALDSVPPGSTIAVRPGRYREKIYIWQSVTLKSEYGPAATVIDGNQEGDVVWIDCDEGASAVLDGFTVTNSGSGHGISTWLYTAPVIRNCIVTDNWSTGGGGISVYNEATIVNTIITGNGASSTGAAILCDHGSKVAISHCTIVDNYTARLCGGIHCDYGAEVSIHNSILCNNSFPNKWEIYLDGDPDPCSVTISHSLVKGGRDLVFVEPGCTLNWGAGMIDSDPLFVNPAARDFHLTFDSPCRSAGDPAAPGQPWYDFEGDPRPALYPLPDMGADEFNTHLCMSRPVSFGLPATCTIIGWPQTAPVVLISGSGVLAEPLVTLYGNLHLRPPWPHRIHFTPIPNNGVREITRTVSAQLPPGLRVPIQALVGTELTNLEFIESQ